MFSFGFKILIKVDIIDRQQQTKCRWMEKYIPSINRYIDIDTKDMIQYILARALYDYRLTRAIVPHMSTCRYGFIFSDHLHLSSLYQLFNAVQGP